MMNRPKTSCHAVKEVIGHFYRPSLDELVVNHFDFFLLLLELLLQLLNLIVCQCCHNLKVFNEYRMYLL